MSEQPRTWRLRLSRRAQARLYYVAILLAIFVGAGFGGWLVEGLLDLSQHSGLPHGPIVGAGGLLVAVVFKAIAKDILLVLRIHPQTHGASELPGLPDGAAPAAPEPATLAEVEAATAQSAAAFAASRSRYIDRSETLLTEAARWQGQRDGTATFAFESDYALTFRADGHDVYYHLTGPDLLEPLQVTDISQIRHALVDAAPIESLG